MASISSSAKIFRFSPLFLIMILSSELFPISEVSAYVACYSCSTEKFRLNKNCTAGPFDNVEHSTCSEPNDICVTFNNGKIIKRLCYPWNKKIEPCLNQVGLGPDSCALSSRWTREIKKCGGEHFSENNSLPSNDEGRAPESTLCFCAENLCNTVQAPNPNIPNSSANPKRDSYALTVFVPIFISMLIFTN